MFELYCVSNFYYGSSSFFLIQGVVKVEEAVYNEFEDANDHRYRSRIRSRVSNLNRNPAIGYQLINGKIKPERVKFLF